MRFIQKHDSGERGALALRVKRRRLQSFSGGSHPPLATSQRRGFTIIELLVVIAIIAVLASMIIGASMRVIGVQSQKNTTLLVQKVANAVNAQWVATVEQANNEKLPPPMQAMLQGGTDPRQVRAMYINLRLAQQFPQSYAAALSPGIDTTPPMPGMVPADPFYANMLGASPSDPRQSGVLLWLMLKNSRNGAIFNQDTFTPREATPSSIPNVFCLVDDWKNPLQFQRMPYQQYIGLNPQGANQFANSDLSPQQYPQLYFAPVVASQGPPGPGGFGPTIYSFQLLIGGPNGS